MKAHYNYSSFQHIYRQQQHSHIRRWLSGLALVLVLIILLPWTQNIRSRGSVTTLRQEQRPQQLHSAIPGRIVKWYFKEGDLVKKGDTILQLTEIKEDYLDPELITRTRQQLQAKQKTVDFYQGKASTTAEQVNALLAARELKTEQLANKQQQLQLKLQSDSMDLIAAQNDYRIAQVQYQRSRSLYDSGLVSLTQLEQRNQALQNALAKRVSAENKFSNSRQDIRLNQLELAATRQDYAEKIAKAEGDQLQSLSAAATGEGEVAKLQNQYSNYAIRSGMYFVTAPQDGQISKARKSGIGEIIKEGEMLVEVVPDRPQFAVEMFVRPVDLPLISKGQPISLVFDGFPAIVFSGWPQASYGIFQGQVNAIENAIGANGLFRVLITEKQGAKPWPPHLRVGTGVNGIALLKDVPVWYELWRNINGFPPDYYQYSSDNKKSPKP